MFARIKQHATLSSIYSLLFLEIRHSYLRAKATNLALTNFTLNMSLTFIVKQGYTLLNEDNAKLVRFKLPVCPSEKK